MGLFQKLFAGKGDEPEDPEISFGRYSDAYKPDYKYDAWDLALDLFDEGKYEESFTQFFIYLKDEAQDNLKTWTDDEGLHFELFQGSKLVKGLIGKEMITAESRVAKATKLSIGFLRRMMELNYNMKYGRYALDDEDHLSLIFNSYLLDGSPYKLYFGLKEIAVSADKQDDLLVNEFQSLEPVNTGHLKQLPEQQIATKIKYLRSEINRVLAFIDNGKFHAEQFAGGVGYMLLDMAYRLDYLIKPEGKLTESLERVHRIYFANDNKSSSDKNSAVRKEYEKILERTDEELAAELYLVSSSFGITSPGSHEQLKEFVETELRHMDWYVENRHLEMAMSFPGYITGYSLFNFAFQPPLKDLLHLFYRITQADFFEALGFGPRLLDSGTAKLNKGAIQDQFERIEDRHKEKYPKFRVDDRAIDYSSLTGFAKSYFLMFKGLDLTKKGR